MNDPIRSLLDLEGRLAKLERQNRRWKYLGSPFRLLARSIFLLAKVLRKRLSAASSAAKPTAVYDTLVVRRLELRDKAGNLRAGWSAEDDGSLLMLLDPAGKVRAGLTMTAKGPGLTLYDPAGKIRAELSEDSLEITDAQQFRAVVGVTALGTIATGESDTTSAAAVTLFGKDGKVIWRAP
jgi:hypothetical protein